MNKLEELLEQLLQLSQLLLEKVQDPMVEPEEWIEVLDRRQEIMDGLSRMFDQGEQLSAEQKQRYLAPAFELDKICFPIMERKKGEAGEQLDKIRNGRMANKQYAGHHRSYSLYGAFFDKKK